jgi:manganese/iron transport system permease protein
MDAMIAGTYVSFFIDSAPAPTFVLIPTALVILAFARRQILNRRVSAQAGKTSISI